MLTRDTRDFKNHGPSGRRTIKRQLHRLERARAKNALATILAEEPLPIERPPAPLPMRAACCSASAIQLFT